jgi:hypothetical protein
VHTKLDIYVFIVSTSYLLYKQIDDPSFYGHYHQSHLSHQAIFSMQWDSKIIKRGNIVSIDWLLFIILAMYHYTVLL